MFWQFVFELWHLSWSGPEYQMFVDITYLLINFVWYLNPVIGNVNKYHLAFHNRLINNYNCCHWLRNVFLPLTLALVVFQGPKGTRGYPGFPVRGRFSTCPLEGMPDWPLTNQISSVFPPSIAVARIDCGSSDLLIRYLGRYLTRPTNWLENRSWLLAFHRPS